MDKKVLEFTPEKETKRTWKFEEVTQGQPPICGSLYVQKWALGISEGERPKNLKVTIEEL